RDRPPTSEQRRGRERIVPPRGSLYGEGPSGSRDVFRLYRLFVGISPTGPRGHGGSALRQPALLHGVADDPGPALQAELLHGAGLVRLDGLDAHVELGGDLLVGQPAGDPAEHLGLALAEQVAGRVAARGRAAEEAADDLAGEH